MSKAYKCDRCGKLFEHYRYQVTNFYVTRNANFAIDRLDLCPKCNAELQSWVANDTVQVDCNCTDEEVAKSFVEDVEAVKDFLDEGNREICGG